MSDERAPKRIWLDPKSVPPNDQYAGTYYLDNGDEDEVPCIEYVRADLHDAQAENDRLRKAMNNIYENVEYWNTLQISSKIRDALQRKEGDE